MKTKHFFFKKKILKIIDKKKIQFFFSFYSTSAPFSALRQNILVRKKRRIVTGSGHINLNVPIQDTKKTENLEL